MKSVTVLSARFVGGRGKGGENGNGYQSGAQVSTVIAWTSLKNKENKITTE